jgi:glycosyltransferase involved in cell wall biosynthesis
MNAVWQRQPETEFILAGWDTSGYHIPFPHLACGTVGLDDLPNLYSQCDVALVLSLTNISLLPLELMACGCAVVSNQGPNVEWLLNDEVSVLSGSSPEQLTDAICHLLQDDERREAISSRAEVFTQGMTWEHVALGFAVGLQKVREQSRREETSCAA